MAASPGQNNVSARLTKEQVAEIVALPKSVLNKVIAADYKISIGHAWRVRNGTRWKFLWKQLKHGYDPRRPNKKASQASP